MNRMERLPTPVGVTFDKYVYDYGHMHVLMLKWERGKAVVRFAGRYYGRNPSPLEVTVTRKMLLWRFWRSLGAA